MMEKRNTIQKELVYNAVNELKNHPTADEVYGYIAKSHPSISKGTVYRNLYTMVEDGRMRRVKIPDGSDRYDHNLDEHYHVECANCKRVFDVQMDILPDLSKHIYETNGIQFLGYDILFKGICLDCQQKNKKEIIQ
ncbi:transcriptional repressor [Clostridiaceae bacterium OttesenSCG-928-D20]|nr:transcriptional repressor [Clostridiaceae bacterium OttesenSCG-928-D20]